MCTINFGPAGRAVVTGDNNQRIAGKAVAFERLDDLPDGPVHLNDIVAVATSPAASPDKIRRRDRAMRRRQRKIQKKRPVRRFPGVLVDMLNGLLRQVRQNLHVLKARRNGSFAPPTILVGLARFYRHRGFIDNMVVFDVAVRRHIQGRGNSEEIVEAEIVGSGNKGLAEIGLLVA